MFESPNRAVYALALNLYERYLTITCFFFLDQNSALLAIKVSIIVVATDKFTQKLVPPTTYTKLSRLLINCPGEKGS